MKMSWTSVVGIKRVVGVRRYVEEDVEVWRPRPRRRVRDSSGGSQLGIKKRGGGGRKVPVYPRLKTIKIMAIATGARYLHCDVSKLLTSHASNTCPNAHSSAVVDFSELARHFVHTTTRVRVPIKHRTSIER
jgi:hypothetical protein